MRPSFPAAALLSMLLAACASAPEAPSKAIAQSGALKVHPGLLGQSVPPELQPEAAPAQAVATPDSAAPVSELKMDQSGLRTQRSVYFDLDSADLKAEFTAMLQAHARYLAEHPAARVRVEGNADERGPAGHNRRLGQKRAERVKQALVGHGARDKQVAAITLGATKPRLKGHDEESWAENRRADIVYEQEK